MSDFEDFMDLARMRIESLPPGIYKIGEIYGELWPDISNHHKLGEHFKTEVLAGRVAGIEWDHRGADNNQRYRVI